MPTGLWTSTEGKNRSRGLAGPRPLRGSLDRALAHAVDAAALPVGVAAEGVLDGVLDVVPAGVGGVLGALPAAAQVALDVVELAARVALARLRAVAVGGLQVLELAALGVRAGAVGLAPVVVLVDVPGDAVPGVLGGALGLLPLQARGAARLVPAARQVV